MGCVTLDADHAGELWVKLQKVEELYEVQFPSLKAEVLKQELTQEEYDIVFCLACLAE